MVLVSVLVPCLEIELKHCEHTGFLQSVSTPLWLMIQKYVRRTELGATDLSHVLPKHRNPGLIRAVVASSMSIVNTLLLTHNQYTSMLDQREQRRVMEV